MSDSTTTTADSDSPGDLMSIVFTPVVVQAGLTCLGLHCLLYILYAYVIAVDGPWRKLASLTAHQTITFPLMIYCTYLGMKGWFVQTELAEAGPEARIFDIHPTGHQLGQIVFGAMLFWDIPIGIFTPALRDPLMIGHHIGLLFVSGVTAGTWSGGMPIGTYHANFFFGVIELSSIFLSVMDVFHPRNKAWFDYFHTHKGKVIDLCNIFNEINRNLFAFSYLLLRALYFPYVIASTSIPDFHHAAMLPSEQRKTASQGVLWGVCVFAVLFSILQLYWGMLVMKGVLKHYLPEKKKE